MAPSRRTLTLADGVGIVMVAIGMLAARGQLADNSFLTHLATGRIMWDDQVIVRADPYTFTAAGESWVVQSWLASALYGGLERLGGLTAIRLAMSVTGGLLAGVAWLLTKPASTVTGRLLAVVPLLLIGIDSWAERPLLLGLACLGALLLAAEGRLDPRWLVPVMWVWVNVHGSWPLGVVAIVLLAVGRRLDHAPASTEWRALRFVALGIAVAAANPYGVRILIFPVELLSKREALSGIKEWKPPTYDSLGEQAFVGLLLLGAFALVRSRSWRAALPLVVFGLLAATGARNVLPASFVLLPGIAVGLAGLGTLAGDQAHRLAPRLAAAGGALAAVTLLTVATGEPLGDAPYPLGADAWLRGHDRSPATHRVLAREAVGNWFEFRYGPTGNVFLDDRVELMPAQAIDDHRALLEGAEGWQSILERHGAEAVLWEADGALAEELSGDPAWEITYRDEAWIVAIPAG